MIYLDANATSKLRPEAAEALHRVDYRNPSSIHMAGQKARMALEQARQDLATFLLPKQEDSGEVIFTSGGTESCNAMIFGFLGKREGLSKFPKHIVSSAIEHAAVKESLRLLEKAGWSISWVNPQRNGIVDPQDMLSKVCKETALVTLMAANNETGAVQDIEGLARELRSSGYLGIIASDITQAVLKTDCSVNSLFEAGVDVVSISAHKLGAPAGIGALVFSKGHLRCLSFEPLIVGGPQENRFRSGSENVGAITAFGAVCRHLQKHGSEERARIIKLRNRFQDTLCKNIPECIVLTPQPEALSNTLTISFSGCRGDDLVVSLDLLGVCASIGAACSSGKQQVSEVFLSMGLSEKVAREAIRFSLDWDATEEIVDEAGEIIFKAVSQMRKNTCEDSSSEQRVAYV